MVQLVPEGVGVSQEVGGVEGSGRDDFVGLSSTGGDFAGEEGEERRCEGVRGVNDPTCKDAARVMLKQEEKNMAKRKGRVPSPRSLHLPSSIRRCCGGDSYCGRMREKMKSILHIAPDNELAELRGMKTRGPPLESTKCRWDTCGLVTFDEIARSFRRSITNLSSFLGFHPPNMGSITSCGFELFKRVRDIV